MYKGFKCLDVSTRCIYISRDVVFDETLFPFSKLHDNAGARLQSEILLLPSSLFPSDTTSLEGNDSDAPVIDSPETNEFLRQQ